MKHKKGTRKQWLSVRLKLLEAEKDLTRHSDELARRRQKLLCVRIKMTIDLIPKKGTHP